MTRFSIRAMSSVLAVATILTASGPIRAGEQCNAGSDLLIAAKASAWSYSIQPDFQYNGHGFRSLAPRLVQHDLCTQRTVVIRHQSKDATVETILSWNDDTIVLAFAGTTSEAARLQNLKTEFGEYLVSAAATHRGWSKAILAVEPRITAQLNRLADGRRILLTGHSSGGALAAYFLAMHLQQRSEWVRGATLITLGASRYSQPAFAKWMHQAASQMEVEIQEVVSRGRTRAGRLLDAVPGWRRGLVGVGEKVFLDLGDMRSARSNDALHDPMTYLLAAAQAK